ncbi:MAG: TrkA family potassium uptake protein [Thermomicrobiales bacterium]
MNIVIVGCGRVGAHLATALDHRGESVTIVDRDPNAFHRLESDFGGLSIRGTGIDEDVLRTAHIDEADGFLAVTNWDNTNLMAAQVAKVVFGVEFVAARVYDPVRAEIFANMGIVTISPTITITNLLLDALESANPHA